MRSPLRGPAILGALAVALAVSIFLAFDNHAPFDAPGGHIALAVIGGVLVAGGALAWALSVRGAASAAQEAERHAGEARAQREGAEQARERAEAEAAKATDDHDAERARREEAEQRIVQEQRERQDQGRKAVAALHREREWNRELRNQVVSLNRQFGGAAPSDDVRGLVLRVAMKLLEADKGLLLSRVDDNEDGRLDVVAEVGFEADGRRSELAQRFAREVIERDAIVREDDPGDGDARADREIHNLVAIPIWIQDDFSGVVVCADRDGGFEGCDDEVLLALGDHAGAVLQNASLHGRVRASHLATVRLLAEALQAKDPFLRGHSEEVADYVTAVARQFDLEPSRREQLTFASLLHDVGKIGISERILLKPGKLTPEERSVIELHPRIGFRLVEQVPGMEAIAPVILHHHERFDGAGYPARLRGEEIPLEARIVCVADSFSAMTEQRPYRDRMSLEAACAELERCAGSQFDPKVVRLFVDEVRTRPRPAEPGPVAMALADAELEARRVEGEPVLGAGTFSLTDNLTLLYSHRYFHETADAQAERAAVQGSPFAVAVAELTSLPAVNAGSGYAAGDECLRAVARALSRVAVRHGATACRISGRRLALVVAEVDEPGTAALGAELEIELGRAATCRIGVAAWRPGETGDQVIARARLGLVAEPPQPAA